MTDIPGYEGLYAATKAGKIWSYPKPLSGALEGKGFTKGRWLKPLDSNGYESVNLGADNMCAVHRLIAITFLPKDSARPWVNHKDGDKKNNNVSNIEWCTPAENNLHARVTGLNVRVKKISYSEYNRIAYLSKLGFTHAGIGELYGVGKSTIGRVLNSGEFV